LAIRGDDQAKVVGSLCDALVLHSNPRCEGCGVTLSAAALHASLCQSSLIPARYGNSIMRAADRPGAPMYPVGRMQGVRLSGGISAATFVDDDLGDPCRGYPPREQSVRSDLSVEGGRHPSMPALPVRFGSAPRPPELRWERSP
jgi:hypothetical protein